MEAKLKRAFELLKNTYQSWSEDKASRLAAALAYYTIFSIAPLLVIAIAIAGLVFGHEAARGQITEQIRGVMGPTSAAAVQDMLANAQTPASGIIATIIGVVTLLFGAAGVFGQLQDALNTIWGVEPKPGRGILATVKERFLSFAMVLGVGFLLLVSLLVSAGISALTKFVGHAIPGVPWLWEAVNNIVSFGVFGLLFAMIFKILPDAKVQWRDVWIGALMTSLLFILGKFAIGLYLGRSSVASSYGAAGSLVVLLLWIYYSAQILFFGAEFTQVYATASGTEIEPAEGAIAVTQPARAEQGLKGEKPAARSAAAARTIASINPTVSQSAHPAVSASAVAPVPPGPADGHVSHVSVARRFGREITAAGLVGAAVGVLLGYLRPARHAARH